LFVTALEQSMESAQTAITQSFRFALDPSHEQANLLRSHVGGSRFAYNALLGLVKNNWDEIRAKKDAGQEVSREDFLSTSHFGLLYLWAEQRDQLAPWWRENGSSTYNDAAQRLSRAITNFHSGKAQFPRFKSRGHGGSVRFMNTAVRLTDTHHVRVSRVGEIKTYESTRKLFRHLQRGTGRILAATVAECCGRWTIAFTVEVQRTLPATRAPKHIIGIDLGITTLYTGAMPDGTQVLNVENPRHVVTVEKQLTHVQRIASRRHGPCKGGAPSERWKKANGRVQKIHIRTTNARRNLIHTTTSMLAKNYDVIVVEDLNVAGMMKNHALAKHISDAAWGEFTRQLEYKTKWYGSTLVKVDRFYPSSKTCASCGKVKAKLTLSTRTYACEFCGQQVDRDLNAATNLARQGLAGTSSVTGRRGEVRPKHQKYAAKAHPGEASTETHTWVSV
jgi:putative transposase